MFYCRSRQILAKPLEHYVAPVWKTETKQQFIAQVHKVEPDKVTAPARPARCLNRIHHPGELVIMLPATE
jgi:hypothetical protein